MGLYARFLVAFVALSLFTLLSGQDRRLPRRVFPPDIIVPAGTYGTELNNQIMRVSRGKMPGNAVLPGWSYGRGLFIAISDVELQVKPAVGPNVSIRLRADETKWFDGAGQTITLENTSADLCEFLFVEAKGLM